MLQVHLQVHKLGKLLKWQSYPPGRPIVMSRGEYPPSMLCTVRGHFQDFWGPRSVLLVALVEDANSVSIENMLLDSTVERELHGVAELLQEGKVVITTPVCSVCWGVGGQC